MSDSSKSTIAFVESNEIERRVFSVLCTETVERATPEHLNWIRNCRTCSSPQEWRDKGVQYHAQGLLEEALFAFERAQDHHQAQRVQAEIYERDYEIHLSNDLLLDAAKLRQGLGEHFRAAKLYQRASSFSEAADIFVKLGKILEAADCLSSANELLKMHALVEQYADSVLGHELSLRLCEKLLRKLGQSSPGIDGTDEEILSALQLSSRRIASVSSNMALDILEDCVQDNVRAVPKQYQIAPLCLVETSAISVLLEMYVNTMHIARAVAFLDAQGLSVIIVRLQYMLKPKAYDFAEVPVSVFQRHCTMFVECWLERFEWKSTVLMQRLRARELKKPNQQRRLLGSFVMDTMKELVKHFPEVLAKMFLRITEAWTQSATESALTNQTKRKFGKAKKRKHRQQQQSSGNVLSDIDTHTKHLAFSVVLRSLLEAILAVSLKVGDIGAANNVGCEVLQRTFEFGAALISISPITIENGEYLS